MRMSCNGCRVLRKGCSQNCIIRPCLQWIKSPDSQANATLFLAKFYGRAGLLNLIEAGPENLRPAIFMSLLYEACGRVVNPVYGSVGMLWSRSWVECQAAVDAVLKGSQITETSSESLAQQSISPLKTYDIRHVFKDPNTSDIDKVKSRTSLKRSATKSKRHVDSKEDESMFSVETEEGSLVTQTKEGPLLKLGNQTEEIADISSALRVGALLQQEVGSKQWSLWCFVVTTRSRLQGSGVIARRIICLDFRVVNSCSSCKAVLMTLKRHSWRFQDLVVPPRRWAEGRKARVSFWDMLMGFSMEANRSTKALTEEDIELFESSVYTKTIEGIPLITFLERIMDQSVTIKLLGRNPSLFLGNVDGISDGSKSFNEGIN
ncbi:hypothetical protein J1N35_006058 [Gossypium stocksii]|uniref:LOB domain-containing protein n=1 Tax=Gossypium stocksii TaxID=47602 RepID=A0A9D4AJK5_9ROSI|nr:hypothetical protein J1N35_006058 [Gossypium stocksii]